MSFKYLFFSFVLNIRVLFLLVAFVHLLFVAAVTLSIDTTVDDDPKIRAYSHIRWKLLTCWFNLITLWYLPTRLYCEWKTNQNEKESHVEYLKKLSDVIFTSIITPITVFSDLAFWFVYLTDSSWLAPVKLYYYMPLWAQHSLHTVSLVTVFTDLILIPRSRPPSLNLHICLLFGFVTIYFTVMYYNLWRGVVVYAFLEQMSLILHIAMIFISYLSCSILFIAQWFIIDARWKYRSKVA